MFNRLLTSIFGSRNDRNVSALKKIVIKINALEPEYQKLSDEQLRGKTEEFRKRLAEGKTLDDLLPEAFAAVREASRRTLGLRHYDVQLIGGMVLHQGKIAEMRTGEGKTLVATAPVYLNALPGKGVHVVTVNDYLARRDANWMRPVYAALGMDVGIVVPGMRPDDKRAAYAADITYGTNNEYGFDYLRDNMALRREERFQRAPFYAIVDEVDSILIDEARTPLIISGPADDSPQMYVKVNRIVPKLIRQATEEGEGDFWVDEKQKQVHLSEAGMSHAEGLLREAGVLGEDDSLWDAKNLMAVHHLNAGLRAHSLYSRDVDYIVRDGEVIIVDEFTGRTLAGRRWSDGLHQAVEAKEGVPIQRENQTLASITFQNYFRLYKKLSGMTGTADTEAYEFQNIYGLEVVVIPTHRPMVRKDHADLVFLKQDGKFRAVLNDIKDCYARKQPVLVGTTSIETSELISRMLTKEGLPHEVLNAKQHEREAHIVAQAGRPGAVTIATNMAGRGTDIVLGGNLEAELHALPEGTDDATRAAVRAAWKERHAEVLASGGLHIIGTERHESRRIDNQLRGRSGRQGDPGSSRFYLSLEDNLMRIFAPGWMGGFMEKWGGMQQDDALESGMVTRQIEKMQRKCEAHNFDIRKHLLEYDDVANDQRKVIYEQRNELLDAETVDETVRNIRSDVFDSIARQFVPEHSIDEQWDLPGLSKKLETDFGIHVDLVAAAAGHSADFTSADLWKIVQKAAVEHFEKKEQEFGAETMRSVEKYLMLQVLDQHWKDHLASMDYLRQGIHLRGYAQKQPKQEFKREAFELFSSMLDEVKLELTTILARVRLRSEEEVQQMEEEQQRRQQAAAMQFQHSEAQAFAPSENEVAAAMASGDAGNEIETQALAAGVKVGRNDPCPCGSGKKYKSCHGKIA